MSTSFSDALMQLAHPVELLKFLEDPDQYLAGLPLSESERQALKSTNPSVFQQYSAFIPLTTQRDW
jgi:hypothetical protein